MCSKHTLLLWWGLCFFFLFSLLSFFLVVPTPQPYHSLPFFSLFPFLFINSLSKTYYFLLHTLSLSLFKISSMASEATVSDHSTTSEVYAFLCFLVHLLSVLENSLCLYIYMQNSWLFFWVWYDFHILLWIWFEKDPLNLVSLFYYKESN